MAETDTTPRPPDVPDPPEYVPNGRPTFSDTGPKKTLATIDAILAEAGGKPVAQSAIVARAWPSVDPRDAALAWVENYEWRLPKTLERNPDLAAYTGERVFAKGYGRPADETQGDRYDQGTRQFIVNRMLTRRMKTRYRRVTSTGVEYTNVMGEPLGHPYWMLAPEKEKATPTEEPVTLANIFPPKGKPELDLLRESIRRFGVLSPVVVDENGEIITGHNRSKIARELGIFCPTTEKSGLSDEEKMILNIEDNLSSRHLSKDEKVVLFVKLRRLGWTQAVIAKHCGVKQGTVSKGLAEYSLEYSDATLPDKIISKTGKIRPAKQKTRKAKAETPVPEPTTEPKAEAEPEQSPPPPAPAPEPQPEPSQEAEPPVQPTPSAPPSLIPTPDDAGAAITIAHLMRETALLIEETATLFDQDADASAHLEVLAEALRSFRQEVLGASDE